MHHPAQPLPPAPSPIPAATAAPLPAAHTPAAASAAPPAAAAPARPAPVKLAAAISPTQSPAQPDAPIFGAPQAPAPIATNASPGRPIAPLPASPSPLPAAVAPVADLPRKPLPPVLDDAVLDELRSMLGGEVDRLIDIFLEDCPRLIEALENAASGPDYVGLRDAAHSLKSSSANLGAMSLSTAARRIELAAREQALERPAVAVALVANEFQRARQALRKLQQHQPS